VIKKQVSNEEKNYVSKIGDIKIIIKQSSIIGIDTQIDNAFDILPIDKSRGF